MGRPIQLVAIALSALPGCGDESPKQPSPGVDAGHDAAADGCAAGTVDLGGGVCQPAGVSPDGCGEGFSAADVGCAPLLPDQPCGDGTLAVPGDAACHPVAPCGAGDFGDVPSEATTQWVLATAPAAGADGSQAKPWPTIQQGVDAAAANAIVAIGAGSYAQDVVLDHPVRLWGKCPSETGVVGSAQGEAAVIVGPGAAASELHAIGVQGGARGVWVQVDGASIDASWIHDTAGQGVAVGAPFAGGSATVRASLIERATDLAVFVYGADATLESTVVRGTRSLGGHYGRGLDAELSLQSGKRARLSATRCVVEDSREFGIFVSGSDATIARTVVRGVAASTAGGFGFGVDVKASDGAKERGMAAFTQTIIEKTVEAGIFTDDADLSMTTCSVRDVASSAAGKFGRCIELTGPLDGITRPKWSLDWTVAERCVEVGVLLSGGDTTSKGLVVRDVSPGPMAGGGRGVCVQRAHDTEQLGTLALQGGVVMRTRDVGVYFINTSGSLDGVAVLDTSPAPDGLYGDGVGLLGSASKLIVTRSRIEASQRAGLSTFGGAVDIGDTTFECNKIALVGEVIPQPFALTDLGGNTCGCQGDTTPCEVRSSGLGPPAPPGM